MFGLGQCGINTPSSQELRSMFAHRTAVGQKRWVCRLELRLYLRGAQEALVATAQHALCPLLERLPNEGEGKESSMKSSLDFSVGIISPGLQQ